MKAPDIKNGLFSGRMGNIIYYIRNGKTFARRVSLPENEKKQEIKERTPKQKEANARFRIVQQFYSMYSKYISPEIWRLAAEKCHRTAPNCFNSANSKCFDGKGKLVEFEKMLFTQGALLLPRKMEAQRNGQHCRVTWKEEREWETAAPTDRLCVGVLYTKIPLGPRLAMEVKGTRKDLCGEFMLDPTIDSDAHVYCFFARKNDKAFSESQYFWLPKASSDADDDGEAQRTDVSTTPTEIHI